MSRKFVLRQEPVEEPGPLTIAYSDELNDRQYEAVTSTGGATLVVAGAGTGKTRTLVYRVAYLVETGVKPEHILLLTFTRRAAREMLSRASALLDGRCERVRGGTFHAFCLQLLKRYAPLIGYPPAFTILDASDAADVIDVLRTAKGLHRSEKRFPKKRTIRDVVSAAANRRVPLADVLEADHPQFLIHLDILEELRRSYRSYKKTHGLMDYDDLLENTLLLFEQSDKTRVETAAAYRHVLVDEYQDTNRLQADLVARFASVHGNVMAVGDDAQSIYRFRGADPRNIFEFPERYPPTRIVTLEQNYRSTQPILDLANYVIQQASRKYEKRLYTERSSEELPAFVQAPDNEFESRFICQMVLRLREEGVPLSSMAVLFRSSHNSYDLELALNRRKIPFVKYGGLRLTEAAHIKDVLAYFKIVENPRDVVSWNRILLLLEGVGPRNAQRVIDWISEAEDPLRVGASGMLPNLTAHLAELEKLLDGLRTDTGSVARQIDAVVRYYEPILERVHLEDAAKRKDDLDRFVALAENFPTRTQMLQDLALDPLDLTAVDTDASRKDEAPLVLSTIHSAKGLEFDSVFLIQSLDGVLPSGFSLDKPDELDEELRLLYVALTRAENRLFVSYPVLQQRPRFGDYFSRPSRFLERVPEKLLEPWTLIEEKAGQSATGEVDHDT